MDDVIDFTGRPAVKHWEIGNEPDFAPSAAGGEHDSGSCFGDDPAAYAEMLRVSHRAIHAADPSAVVLFGGVAYDRFIDAEDRHTVGPFRRNFVRSVLDELHTAHGDDPNFTFFDWIGFHNYNGFRNRWDGAHGPELVGKAAAFRADQLVAADRYDVRDMPLISTEVGLRSAPTDQYTTRSEDYRAAYAGRVAARAAEAGLDVAVWYTARDYPSDDNCDDLYSWLLRGLMRSQHVDDLSDACAEDPLSDCEVEAPYERKPTYLALATASRLLGEAEFVDRLSEETTGDAQIEARRLRRPDGSWVLVAFTDHGERLGRKASEDVSLDLEVTDEWLALGAGKAVSVRRVDHLRGRGAGRRVAGQRARDTSAGVSRV